MTDSTDDVDGYDDSGCDYDEDTMSVWDFYAAAALSSWDNESVKQMAENAAELADALIAERKKRMGG
jgi:hypothetical protein